MIETRGVNTGEWAVRGRRGERFTPNCKVNALHDIDKSFDWPCHANDDPQGEARDICETLTNERLIELAAEHAPPIEWLDSDEECLF